MRRLKVKKRLLEKHKAAYEEGVVLGLTALAKGQPIPFATGALSPSVVLKRKDFIVKYAKKILSLQKCLKIESLVFMRPTEIVKFVREFNAWYALHVTNDNIRKEIKSFISSLFDYGCFRAGKKYSVRKGKIVTEPNDWCLQDYLEALDVKYCCYCNDGILHRRTPDGDSPALRSPFDHYFPRKEFPMLGLTLVNLVPSCPECNGSGRKGDKYFDVNEFAYPYRDDFHDQCGFIVDLKEKGVDLFLRTGQRGDISIAFERRTNSRDGGKTEKFLQAIKIDRLYNDDLQEEALRYIRNIGTFPKSRRRYLLDLLTGATLECIVGDHFGVSLKPSRINQERHGKLAIDIVQSLAPRRWCGDLK